MHMVNLPRGSYHGLPMFHIKKTWCSPEAMPSSTNPGKKRISYFIEITHVYSWMDEERKARLAFAFVLYELVVRGTTAESGGQQFFEDANHVCV